ncbi:endo-1,4-beta-xylanase [Treponema bryantii]|uniref:endo-1,4-beta-xylanase n=1 Tax=Treponema bryantii TaxID=163 RepID=UPI002B308CD5|nr:hypothetical protein TRBR_04550 [Treponema bryantii]
MMKRTLLTIAAALLLITGCSSKNKTPQTIENSDGSVSITRIDEDGKAILFNRKFGKDKNVTQVRLHDTSRANPVSIDLSPYEGKDIEIQLSCEMFIDDNTTKKTQVIWMINELEENFPKLFDRKVDNGKWFSVNKHLTLHLSGKRQLYVSGGTLNKEATVYIKNFKLRLNGEGLTKGAPQPEVWTEVTGVKDVLKDYFDYFGFCVSYNNTFKEPLLQQGLPLHASVITMENEFKPDFIFGWNKPNKLTEFRGEDGNLYEVPADIPTFKQMDSILSDMKKLGLKLRGHTLVWHSQTPAWFFQKNYGHNGETALVSPDEMNARMEWYIKTVLQHVAEWEKKNNNGEHMILAWDVVNEAASDNATDANFLRDAGSSNWFAVYKNETFIVNAFRYANKYAPKDVKLVYNDYGCASTNKNRAICKIIDAIQAAPDARIDAAGMQTHVGINDSAANFEKAVQNFLSKGINVQITEMDVANGSASYNAMRLKDFYKIWFTMFIKNRKQPGKNGIEGVTLWGVRDEWTWLNGMHKGHTQYPLLFKDKEFHCKPAYYGVIEAANE